MTVVYSWDCNVIRAVNNNNEVRCLPLSKGGRRLRKFELELIARHEFGPNITFQYLGEGEGQGYGIPNGS